MQRRSRRIENAVLFLVGLASVLFSPESARADPSFPHDGELRFVVPLVPVISDQIVENDRVRTWRVPLILRYLDGHEEIGVARCWIKEGQKEGLCLAGIAMAVSVACGDIALVCGGGGAVLIPQACLAGGLLCIAGTGFTAYAGPAGLCKPPPPTGRSSFYLEPPTFAPSGPTEAWPAGIPLQDLFSGVRLLGPPVGVGVREADPPSLGMREPATAAPTDPDPETGPATAPAPNPEPTTEL